MSASVRALDPMFVREAPIQLRPVRPLGQPTPPFDVAQATSVARFHAQRLCRQGVIRQNEIDDCQQELLLAAVARWGSYSPRRASPATFVSIVMRNTAVSIARARRAAKRGGNLARNAPLAELESISAYDMDADRATLRRDIHAVVATLPEERQLLVQLLARTSMAAAARALGVPRAAVRSACTVLRARFLTSGLQGYR